MQFSRACTMALKSLLSSKMRAFLTMLGIIIGVASVIVIVSLVNGFSNTMTSAFASFGANNITATVTHPLYYSKIDADELFEFVAENNDLIAYASPQISTSGTLKKGDVSLSSSGTGVSEDYTLIQDFALQSGAGINYINLENYDKVIVLGSYQAKELFGYEDPIGEYIKFNGEQFTVAGVLEERAGSASGTSDDTFLIPYTTAGRLSRNPIPYTYSFTSTTSENAVEAKEKIETFYLEKIENEDYYMIICLEEMLDEVNNLTGMLTLLLVGIAGISLLVGGIGIMNIMLVSVTERTREIGIRKSLGGKRRDILTQFIIESGVTSSVGGIIGVILGIVTSFFVGGLIGVNVVISIPSIIVSFSISAGIGLFFGYFPALKASKLNPIDALRYD